MIKNQEREDRVTWEEGSRLNLTTSEIRDTRFLSIPLAMVSLVSQSEMCKVILEFDGVSIGGIHFHRLFPGV